MSGRGHWERRPLIERLLSRFQLDKATGCWLWAGGVNAQGYGLILPNGDPRPVRVHRAAYEILVGPIPDGLTLDHVCHNADPHCPGGASCIHRRCINPRHLEPVERAVNVQRGAARRLTCRRGHPYETGNGRGCPVCARDARRESHRRQRGDALLVAPAERTHCPKGHEYNEANTYRRPNGNRHCRACHREAVRNAKRARRAAA